MVDSPAPFAAGALLSDPTGPSLLSVVQVAANFFDLDYGQAVIVVTPLGLTPWTVSSGGLARPVIDILFTPPGFVTLKTTSTGPPTGNVGVTYAPPPVAITSLSGAPAQPETLFPIM